MRSCRARWSNEQAERTLVLGEEGIAPGQFRVAPAEDGGVVLDHALHAYTECEWHRMQHLLIDVGDFIPADVVAADLDDIAACLDGVAPGVDDGVVAAGGDWAVGG